MSYKDSLRREAKQQAKDARRARIEAGNTSTVPVRSSTGATSGGLASMSPVAQANFKAAAALMLENPPWLAEMLTWTDEHWTPILAGIADTERFDFPREEVLDNAWRYLAWAILTKVSYIFDWEEPLYEFTPEAFVDRLRREFLEGRHSNG